MATTIDSLRGDLETAKAERAEAERALEDARRALEIEIDDVERKNRYEMEDLREEHRRELERIRRAATDDQEHERKKAQEEIDRLLRNHREELASLERQLKTQLEAEQERRIREVADMASQRDMQLQSIAGDIGKKERETETIRHELDLKASEIEREKSLRSTLETKIAEVSASMLTLEGANRAMKAKIDFLESDNQAQSQAFADLHKRMQEAIEAAEESNAKLRAEETLRRKLHNQIQELKGNIRVFCRVRPPLGSEVDEAAKINFPDQQEESKEVVVTGPEQKSALGNVTAQNHAFSFDRVFGPGSANGQVFEEISQLVQSALDGYNVCIFCYGQTGSGKTHTMSSPDGMIPLAVKQIYDTAKTLGDKGWTYRMEGSFIEVYNENLNDLLGTADDIDKKKHEIRHDPAKCKTTVTDITKVELDSPERVQEVLKRADGNRSVAATKANMRSSRSHSVFILSLVGENSITGERSEGTLNLVDLAGSERLSHSQAEGQRLKETQNINKSLSCLGDVIAALGKGDGGHVPYRNSKLTYLLQFSLGGNSKTLMFVMISPLQAHLSETLTSLKFATKVHNTHIGTAKRQVKTKD
ncbi:kinesin [Trichodelitschia bisporula]|uniref:Kinesin-like protein n=1 Tax=Trichodelitschia bisporula TaxID=703511 RepID=A0A6G1HYT8_9PEZI|nr:kinesin [Trichodelitschia bisporula]